MFFYSLRLTLVFIFGQVVNWTSFIAEAWLKLNYSSQMRTVQRWAEGVEDMIIDRAPDRVAVWMNDVNLERWLLVFAIILILASLWNITSRVTKIVTSTKEVAGA